MSVSEDGTVSEQLTFPAECDCGRQMMVRYCKCGCGQYTVVEGQHECEDSESEPEPEPEAEPEADPEPEPEPRESGDDSVMNIERSRSIAFSPDGPLTGVYYDRKKDLCEECGLKRYSECDCARRNYIEATGYHPDVADVMIKMFGTYF